MPRVRLNFALWPSGMHSPALEMPALQTAETHQVAADGDVAIWEGALLIGLEAVAARGEFEGLAGGDGVGEAFGVEDAGQGFEAFDQAGRGAAGEVGVAGVDLAGLD